MGAWSPLFAVGGAMLEVRVWPRAKQNRVEILPGPRIAVRVTAAPEGGKANAVVVALLAKRLGVAKSQVTVVRGRGARAKLIKVNGLSDEEAFARLAAQ